MSNISTFKVKKCPLCGDALQKVDKKGLCPVCYSRPRTRTINTIAKKVVKPMMVASLADKPLLTFAMGPLERRLLSRVFKHFKSAALYGTYGDDGETGVDIRDLSRYASGSFSGVFASMVFDFFEEHETAISECYRVMAPGGIFFTQMAWRRVVDGDRPPTQSAVKKAGDKGWLLNLPKEGVPDVKVGRAWFIRTMEQAGFTSREVWVKDHASGQMHPWFIGQKPAQTGLWKLLALFRFKTVARAFSRTA